MLYHIFFNMLIILSIIVLKVSVNVTLLKEILKTEYFIFD